LSANVHSLTARRNIGKAKRLLHSLVPRAQCFCLYGADRVCAWSSDGVEDDEIDQFVADLPGGLFSSDGDAPGEAPEFVRRTVPSGRTLLVMPVCADTAQEFGYLVVIFSRNAGKSSWFNASTLHGVLKPAVDVIAETLTSVDALGSERRARDRVGEELALVYALDEKIHGTSRSHAGLAELVGQSSRFLGICYSVLLIPAKRIRISATHSSWKAVKRKVLDRYLVEQVLPMVEAKRTPLILQMAADETSEEIGDGYQTLVCPVKDHTGNIQGIIALLGRVSNRPFGKAHKRFMSHVARKVEYVIERSFDAMTGLMNRSGFEAQLHESWKALSGDNDAHQVIYVDLDNLQLINDTFGRKAGDEVIMRFARVIEEDLPKSAVVSRLTGDDFCVLLTHADTAAASDHARMIRDRVRSLRYLEGDKSLQVSMSAGVAEFSRVAGDEAKALTHARIACEAAREHGRDRIEVYSSSNESLMQRRDDMQLVADIQRALDSDGFDLLAQPIAALGSRSARPRYEILLRMREGDGKSMPPATFFSAAERYHLMPQIDRWVLSRTIAELGRAADDVVSCGAMFAINLSGQSLSDDDILEFIEEEIEASKIPASVLGFEVTESAAVSQLDKAQALISALSGRGCRIALDDFGAGLSSFAYLKNFEVDTLKIDGGFIRDITGNRISESMVAAITQVAKVMQLDTVAEFVEDDAIRELVRELGVDFAQGHVIGRPAPLGDVLAGLNVSTGTG
jgi:diguanylate cyclase (GGDEF)-like protein